MASTNIPQANSVETLTQLVVALADGITTFEGLVGEFAVRERTVHYYLELAEWLGLVVDRRAEPVSLSEQGVRFAREFEQRAEIYRSGVMAHDLVQRGLMHAEDQSVEGLRASFTSALLELGTLAEATARRRAGSLATLLWTALNVDEVDWETGRTGGPTGGPNRMKRNYSEGATQAEDDGDESASWERRRDPREWLGESRFEQLQSNISTVLAELDGSTASQIREELALRFGVPLTDPKVFVVLRAGAESGRWRTRDDRYFLPADR